MAKEEKEKNSQDETFSSNIDQNNLKCTSTKIYLDDSSSSTTPFADYKGLSLETNDLKDSTSISSNDRDRGCCIRLKTALNSRPLFFFTVVFLSVSLAFLFTSLMAIGPVKAEKDALYTSYNESKHLHNTCKSSYDLLKDKHNKSVHDLEASRKENALLNDIIVLKTKEIEAKVNELASAKKLISELQTTIELKNSEISNMGQWQTNNVDQGGTWSFLKSMFSGGTAATPSQCLLLLPFCLIISLIIKNID